MIEELPEFYIESHEVMRDFLDDNRTKISKLTLDAIKYALDENLTYVPIMRIKVGHTPHAIITVMRDNFDTTLTKCLGHLQEAECYEECAEIIKLLKDERLK